MACLLALVALAGAYAGSLGLVLAVRRRPVALAALAALPVLVVLEAGLVHLLSTFRAVAALPLVAGHAIIAGAGLAAAGARGRLRLRGLGRPAGVPFLLGALPPLVLAGLSAALYLPNNWDSMTYHLARVAYWLQARSVGGYATNISRQVVLTPGAEYLLLSLQVISGSDRLANLVQLLTLALLALAMPGLSRALGAPAWAARWAGAIAASVPMAVLQASSTQNDLVAAAGTAAAVAAGLPFLHRQRRWRWPDVALLGAAAAGSAFVKPTAAIVAAPFLAWAVVASARALRDRTARADLARGMALALAVALAAWGPFLRARATVPNPSAVTRSHVYDGLAGPGDRLANALRGAARHFPWLASTADRLAPEDRSTMGCGTQGRLCTEAAFRLHEDYAGNPGHVLLVLAAFGLAVARWRTVRPRARWTLVALGAAWVLFHALVRDNVWLPRLQTPLFELAPLTLAAIGPSRAQRRLAGLAAPVAAGLLAWATLVAARNESRPPGLDPETVRLAASPAAYYLSGPQGLGTVHDYVLASVERTTCRRLGMMVGGDSYDYPISWRAMQAGFEVRHVTRPDGWPCAIFTDRGPPPPGPSGERWEAAGAPFLYVARGAP